MKPQEVRRYPDEAFYFSDGELVIDPKILPEQFPEVILLKGNSTLVSFIDDAAGEVRNNAKEMFWKRSFAPGSRLTTVSTSGSHTEFKRSPKEFETYEFQGEVADSYDIKLDDLLILKASITNTYSESTDGIEVVPAKEPLPGREGDGWELEGIIAADGKLVSWGTDYQRWCVEIALANSLMRNAVDYFQVRDELGFDRSLVGTIDCVEGVKTYLEYIGDRSGTNFVPHMEPREVMESIPADVALTPEQFDRYYPKLPS